MNTKILGIVVTLISIAVTLFAIFYTHPNEHQSVKEQSAKEELKAESNTNAQVGAAISGENVSNTVINQSGTNNNYMNNTGNGTVIVHQNK